MANVRVTGTNFLAATDGPANHLVVDFDAIGSRSYFDPNGPDAAFTVAGATVSTWNNTTIEFTDPGIDGETITQVALSDFDTDYNIVFDVDPDLVVPGGSSAVEIFDAFTFWGNSDQPQGFLPGSGAATANAEPGALFSLSYFTGTDADVLGFRFNTTTGVVDVDALSPGAGQGVSSDFGTDSGSYFVWDTALTGRIITGASLLGAGFTVMHTFDVVPDKELYSVDSVTYDGVDQITVEFTGVAATVPDGQLNVFYLPPAGAPTGPGPIIQSSPGVIEWSADRIVVQNAGFTPGFIATVNAVQVVGTANHFAAYTNDLSL